MARFTGVSLLTENVLQLASFYATALQVTFKGDESHAELQIDGSALAIDSVTEVEKLAPGSSCGHGTGGYLLEFAVPDVDSTFDRLLAAALDVVKPPASYPWGRRAAWFRDPDGNLLNFYQSTSQAATPKEIVRSYVQGVLKERDLSLCDRLLAPDYVDHDAPAEAPPGPESVRAYLSQFLADYPDLQVEIEEMVAEGEKVAVRAVWQGTHGVTGAPYQKTGIVLFRLNGKGQIAERWSAYTSAC